LELLGQGRKVPENDRPPCATGSSFQHTFA